MPTTHAPHETLADRLYWRRRTDVKTMPYLRLLDMVHRQVRPRTYLEIGVNKGSSMTLSLPGTRNIGIDPEPRIEMPISDTTTIFRETSDSFFAHHDVGQLLGGVPLDLAFIDGMHHFEFALRDFINIEQRAAPGTTVLVHDCYPIDEVTAARERTTGKWSGDVWKMIMCLKERRPDLSISVVDIGPTGLGVISGLDPANRTLAEHYDEIEAEYLDMPYDRVGTDKARVLNRVPDDWASVAALLPAQPFRSEPLPWASTRRWLQSERRATPESVARAKGSVKRTVARLRRHLQPTG